VVTREAARKLSTAKPSSTPTRRSPGGRPTKVYWATTALAGSELAEVTATGLATELGRKTSCPIIVSAPRGSDECRGRSARRRVASRPLKPPLQRSLLVEASCGSRAHADDVEDGESAHIPARDSPEVFTSRRGHHKVGSGSSAPRSGACRARRKPSPRSERDSR
jgi:hypothetical protein